VIHAALFYFPTFWHPLSGNGYQLWSGVTGSTSVFAVFLVIYRKMNCHEPGCWRIGKHSVDGTPYVTCHRHHPGLDGRRVRRGHIHAAHHAAKRKGATP
jgi:hypothetical protein